MFSRAKNVKVRVFPLFRGDAMNRRSLEHFIIEYFKDEDIQDFKIGEMIYVKVEKIEPAEALHTDRHTRLDLTVQEDGMDVEKFSFVKRPDENIDESLISSDLAKAYLSLFRNGKEPWKKILLSGEPGTGKTLFAHELLANAQLRGLKTYSIPASMLLGEYIGDTIRVVNSVKRAVGKDSILFIDDCDLILHNRNDMKSFGSLLESVVAFLNFTVILDPTFGLSSVCGVTFFGSAKVFPAFTSGPVMVSNVSTFVGVRSCQLISSSCSL